MKLEIKRLLIVFLLTIPLWNVAQNSDEQTGTNLEHRQEGAFFTNPLLDCESNLRYLPPFKSELNDLINNQIKKGEIRRASVYFRQLHNGYAFGINDNSMYNPASLLKVADMVFILKLAETSPEILKERIKVKETSVPGEPLSLLLVGSDYTIKELIYHMVVYSDNVAKNLLLERFNDRFMWKKVFRDLGVNIKTGAAFPNIISPNEYSTIFRVLYNCSYLNRKMSRFALNLLSKSSYREGIVHGINDNSVTIANKYGLRIREESIQLHEAAIVYLKGSPYLLVVMTEGESGEDVTRVVSQISELIYKRCLESTAIEKQPFNENSEQFSLTSPLLDCAEDLKELKPFGDKVRKLVAEYKTKKEVEDVSVYFRHLTNGRAFEVNGSVKYTPASLLKIAHMIALFKGSESHPETLERNITFDEDLTSRVPNIRDKVIKRGETYSVRALINRMVIHSDNLAANLLFNNIVNENQMWEDLFFELKLDYLLKDKTVPIKVSAREAALFLRILFNSTYLNRSNSEEALEILSKTTFKAGIRKGVGKDVYVASKFGERIYDIDEKSVHELHDLGIIYLEGNPYLLCILTRGSSFEEQATVIEEVSRLIHQEVKKQFDLTITN